MNAPAPRTHRIAVIPGDGIGQEVMPEALRALQVQHEALQRELRRKEKALAEAAALLVLQKKFHALWEGEEK